MTPLFQRLIGWISLAVYGLATLGAQLLHDHAHHSPLENASQQSCPATEAAACSCGHGHGETAKRTAATLTAHSHCAGHHHGHDHHPSRDERDCPSCRFLAVKPVAAPAIVTIELVAAVELTVVRDVAVPDAAPLHLPCPRGPPGTIR